MKIFLVFVHTVTFLFAAKFLAAANENVVDFSNQATPVCEVSHLYTPPPPGWFNVPINSDDPQLRGCQMMRTGESEELVGIMRLLSVTLPASASEPPWFAVMIGLEQESIASMGYTLGGVMWQRDDVPIAGSGFENARAFGLEATIDGNDTPQEAHFLVFEKGEEKYIITLLTPGREVESGVFYKRNTKDFGILIRGLKTPMQ